MHQLILFDFLSQHIETISKRVIFILALALGSHLLVLLIKKLSKLFYTKSHGKSSPKTLSITSLLTSTLVFIIYFLAVGYSLKELGISLTAYIASASVIGLAVGFGSQGIVQDMVTGFTLIISNQIDVGDMVEINGQTGIVTTIGMRFVIFENAFGAFVYIPNRNINVVINYPKKYTNCQVDIILSENAELKKSVTEKVSKIIKLVPERFPNILVIQKPEIEVLKPSLDYQVMRLVFHIWPGRGAPIETTFKQELFFAIKSIDPSFAEWKISVNYEIEKM